MTRSGEASHATYTRKNSPCPRIVAGGPPWCRCRSGRLRTRSPRVVDLMLDGGALSGHDRTFHGVGRPCRPLRPIGWPPALPPSTSSRMALVDEPAHEMALGTCAVFVRHDPANSFSLRVARIRPLLMATNPPGMANAFMDRRREKSGSPFRCGEAYPICGCNDLRASSSGSAWPGRPSRAAWYP